jgi:hypothetical protein
MVELPEVPNLDPKGPSTPQRPAASAKASASPASAPQKPGPEPKGPEVLDEVLEQSTELAVHITHIEELINALRSSHDDLREEMHAGFAEMRANTEAAGADGKKESVAGAEQELWRQGLNERLDLVEEQGRRAAAKGNLGVILAIAQTILIVVLLALLATGRGHGNPVAGADSGASYLNAPAKTDSVATIPGTRPPDDAPAPPPEAAKGSLKKKKKH